MTIRMIDITYGKLRSPFIWLTILTLLLSGSVPALAVPSAQQILFRADSGSPERGWNIAQGGFAEFHPPDYPLIDVDDAGPLEPGFLEVDVYHITRSSSGRNFDVAQYVVWSGCQTVECLDSVKHPGGLPIAILTLVDNNDAADLLKAALGELLVVYLDEPNLLTIKVRDGEIVANIPSILENSGLLSGEITFKNVKKGERQEMRSIFPLYTGYVITQSYTIRDAKGSFTGVLDATASWTTNSAKTIISTVNDELLPYMLGVINSYDAVLGLLDEPTTDPKIKRELDGASEQLFRAITEAQMDRLRTSFDRTRDAVRTLERLTDIEVLPIITMLYGPEGMPIGMRPTILLIGEEADLTGKKLEEFNKKIAQADEAFFGGKYSGAINRLIEAYNIVA
ncbi:MAG TPA: hypothetical protein VIH03_07695 [Nitrososphaerales archaeon]